MQREFLAFDLGGTRLKGAVVDAATGATGTLQTRDLAGATAAEAIEAVIEMGNRMREATRPVGCGLCVPGLVDSGRVTDLVGKLDGIVGRDLLGELREAFEVGAVVVNDAIAYATGEASFGAGRGFGRAVVVTIGTGVGVTVIENGRPVGAGPLGGGILGGHIPVSERSEGHRDTNDQFWTIEALCSAQRIVDYANEAGGSFENAAAVYEAHRAGDAAATGGLDTYRGHLARSLVALGHAHAPDVVVLGGGPMTTGNPVVEGLQTMVMPYLWGHFRFEITTAALGDGAALAGLARLFDAEQGL